MIYKLLLLDPGILTELKFNGIKCEKNRQILKSRKKYYAKIIKKLKLRNFFVKNAAKYKF